MSIYEKLYLGRQVRPLPHKRTPTPQKNWVVIEHVLYLGDVAKFDIMIIQH